MCNNINRNFWNQDIRFCRVFEPVEQAARGNLFVFLPTGIEEEGVSYEKRRLFEVLY